MTEQVLEKHLERASRRLALLLRHNPEKGGLTLTAEGWASLTDVLQALKSMGHPISRGDLLKIVDLNDKKRFTLSPDGRSLRAAQGHTIDIDLGLTPQTPPDVLFHGTCTASLDSIFDHGLQRQKRRHVHLSADLETAYRVGARHGTPIVLMIDAKAMQSAGHVFWKSDNNVWLCETVPRQFFSIDERCYDLDIDL